MKKILYIINVDWAYISHFLPVGIEGMKRGYEIHLACGITDKKEYLESLGFKVHPLSITRSSIKIVDEINTMIEMYVLIKFLNPTIVEFLTIKPVLYGGIVSKILSIPCKVFYITGLGYVFIKKGLKGFILRNIVKILYKFAISGKNSLVITENVYDKELISNLNAVNNNQIRIIRGAGVDLTKYQFREEDNQNIRVSMACRLLKDKGVYEYVEAVKILKPKYPNVNFELYGDIDIYNPASLTDLDVENIKKEGFINVHGFSTNIANVFSNSNIVVLPSYREGLPKVLIEAAASGRSVVTTDVPGCRDAIQVGITGLLCEVKNPVSLANEIEKLLLDDNLRNIMGKSGRILAEKEYDITKILTEHFNVYEENLLN